VAGKKKKRKLDIVVISDVHLGTYGCHAKELLSYLKSINPSTIILNGDIFDIWQFSKRYWPKSHMKIVKYLIGWISEGKTVYYNTGNHDELLRKFVDFKMNNFTIKNKLVLNLNGKQTWFFHGDVFDVTMQHSKWLAKLGAVGYDTLILINKAVNSIMSFFGKGKISLSKKIKDSVKSAVKFANNFEETVANIAIDSNFDYVVCGHIHQPIIKKIETNKGQVFYLNSGDWVENLTALEYKNKQWSLFKYAAEDFKDEEKEMVGVVDIMDQTTKEIFGKLVADLNFNIITNNK
jgi:UDP-2,3-diacylglucosamine pyrophosphatase LpxH